MIDGLRVLTAVAIPWIAGTLLLRAFAPPRGDDGLWRDIGYGHFAGVLLLVVLLKGADAVGLGLSFVPVAALLVVVAAVAGWFGRRHRAAAHDAGVPRASASRVIRALAWVALALIAVRIGSLAAEVLVRPLFPWDAWSQWATKAKVWSALREMVPFIAYDAWLARSDGYTDTAPHYPPGVPLLQAWVALALGRWDDTLVNAPWLAAFIALGIGMFGALRQMGVDRHWAILASYLVLSLPLLDVHVALAGYADLHLAAAYALAVLALAEWERSRTRYALVLLVVCGALLPWLKIPGIAWLGTLALGAAVAAFGASWWRLLGLLAVIVAATIGAALLIAPGRVAIPQTLEQYRVVESLVLQLWAFGNWNLLWYVLPLALAFAWRETLALRGTAFALAGGFGFLAWTFLFTQAGDWVVDYTTVNRALLHIAPAALGFAALVLARREAAAETAPAEPRLDPAAG